MLHEAETEEDETEDIADEQTDKFSLMSRDELKKFSTDNKTGILVKPSMNDDTLRERLREWEEAMAEQGGEVAETEHPTVAEEIPTAPPPPAHDKPMSTADKLKALKARKEAEASK